MPPPPPLCENCSKLDISGYFTQPKHVHYPRSGCEPTPDAVVLGTFPQLYSRYNTCSFCRLVCDALIHPGTRSNWRTVEWFLEQCRAAPSGGVCRIYSYGYASSSSGGEEGGNEGKGKKTGVRIGVAIGPEKEWEERSVVENKAGEIALAVSEEKEGEEWKHLYSGRLVDPEKIDIQLAKRWLRICEMEHGRDCEVPASDPDTAIPDPYPKNLTLIDVVEMRLCCLREEQCRYVALSYCWPANAGGMFMTSKATYKGLQEKGALKQRLGDLTKVVQDAIAFVRDFGEQYLWVDALCIVQDDAESKLEQITQMDLVYGAAIMTIICSHPAPRTSKPKQEDSKDPSVDLGLIGYRPGSRISPQITANIQDSRLIIPYTNIDGAIMDSRWDHRAWTYQEHRLSRRRLLFTDLQLYFQCSCAVFAEDTIGEASPPGATFYRGSTLWNSCDTKSKKTYFDPTWVSRSPSTNDLAAATIYKSLHYDYSYREMTNAGDVVFAFGGVMAVLRRTLGTEFIAGLPEKYFDEAMLWINIGKSMRRIVDVDGKDGKDGKGWLHPYPAWSWTGWDSLTAYAYVWGEASLVFHGVDWFVIGEDWGIRLETAAKHGELYLPEGGNVIDVRAGPIPEEITKRLCPRRELKLSNGFWDPRRQQLACWTMVARFEVTGDYFAINRYGGTAFNTCKNAIIFDRRGVAAGAIIITDTLLEQFVEVTNVYDFMLLSRSEKITDRIQFSDEEAYPRRDWGYLNVMMIKREDGGAFRCGVGVIHEDAWVDAAPTAQFVTLT